ncbi:MAG: hypothetical protein AB3N11_16135, partial [Arenibacterium sp.]
MPTKTKTKTAPKSPASAPAFTTDGFKLWQEIYADSNRFMIDRWQQALDARAAIMSSASPAE